MRNNFKNVMLQKLVKQYFLLQIELQQKSPIISTTKMHTIITKKVFVAIKKWVLNKYFAADLCATKIGIYNNKNHK
jgi:hypothetical protein